MSVDAIEIREAVTYPVLSVQTLSLLGTVFKNLGIKRTVKVSDKYNAIGEIINLTGDDIEKAVRCFDNANLEFLFNELNLEIMGSRTEKQDFLINRINENQTLERAQPKLYQFIDKEYLSFLEEYVSNRVEYSNTLREKHIWGDLLNEIVNLFIHNPRYKFNINTSWSTGDIHEINVKLHPEKLIIRSSHQFNPMIEAIRGGIIPPNKNNEYFAGTNGIVLGKPLKMLFGKPEITQLLSLKVE